MAKRSVPVFEDWIETTRELNDQEKGRLIDAMVLYLRGGDWQERIKGNERYLFPAFQGQIDRQNEISDIRREIGLKGAEAKASKNKQTLANDSKNTTITITNTKTITNTLTNTKEKAEKHKYGDYKNVFLTDEELEKLKERFPTDWNERIQRLDSGIELKGYKYKSHYLAILKWSEKDAPKKLETEKRSAPTASDISYMSSVLSKIKGGN